MRKLLTLFTALLFVGSMWATEYEYQMVTALNQVSAGTYVIGALRSTTATNNFYFATASTSSGYWNVSTDNITIEENAGVRKFDATDLPTGAVEFELSGDNTNGFSISSGTNYLYYTEYANHKLDFAANKTDYLCKFELKSSGLITGAVICKMYHDTNNAYNISENSTTVGAIRGYTTNTIGRGFYLFKKQEQAPSAVAKPTISGETSFYDATNVSISCTTEGADIYYTLDGTTPTASSTKYTAALNLTETKTVKAIAILGDDKSVVSEKTFTKAPEYASIDALVAAELTTGSPVKVSFEDVEITGILNNRNGIYLNVQAAGKDVEIYYASNTVTVPEDWGIGGSVSGTINATWTKFNNSQWEIVPVSNEWKWTDITYTAPTVPAVVITSSTSIDAPAAGKSGKINVAYVAIDDYSSAAVAFYESDGTTPATYDWVTTNFDGDKNVEYTIAASEESEARTAYLKVHVGEVYSDLVTITQAKYIPPFATLPFEFDGGKADIANTAGLTQSGLNTTDYGSSPKLKFDGTGDYVILRINEAPDTLAFYIRGNASSGSPATIDVTFNVQTSADGETYTDLKAYTELSTTTQHESFKNLASTIRYIKWIYTTKGGGNVALGNITVSKPSSPATALEDVDSSVKAVKLLRNGILLIEKNGRTYNAQGQLIK